MNKNQEVFGHRNRQNVEFKSKDTIVVSLPSNIISNELDLSINSKQLNKND